MIFRCDKGAPLTFLEMDENFRELLEQHKALSIKIETMENQIADMALQHIEFMQEGENLVCYNYLKQEIGRWTLPIFRPNLRGGWKEQEYYHMHDWVVFKGKTFGCVQAHVAHDFAGDEKKWRIVIDGQDIQESEVQHG